MFGYRQRHQTCIRAWSGGCELMIRTAEDVAGALAESSGRRASYSGADRIERQSRGRWSMQTTGRAEEGGLEGGHA